MKLLTKSENVLNSLKKIKIEDSISLVSYLPYRYENFSYSDEDNLYDKKRMVLLGRLVATPRLVRTARLDIIIFYFRSNTGKEYLVKAYNRTYLKKILTVDEEWTLVAIYNQDRNELSLVNITKGIIDENNQFKAVYHIPMDLSASTFSSLMKRTLSTFKGNFYDLVPSSISSKYKLIHHEDALNKIHFPKNEIEINEARRTLKYEECLEYCLRNKIIRDANKKCIKTNPKEIDTFKVKRFIEELPFSLSVDQLEASREIVRDLECKALMYRLLQGDVGTGKTLVAIIALYANYTREKQGVMMVPTDSLARQHYENTVKLLSPYGVKVELLVGSLSIREKRIIKEKLINGEIDILIGTHALFSKDVIYPSLGLAIIDEQHRFGVNQRNILASKGDEVDLLLMSATPIPRTLSLSIYGDLDVSSLAVFPGRKREVTTTVCDYNSPKIVGCIEYCLMNNHQVFIVCPKIDASLQSTKSVDEIYEKYKKIYGNKIAYLHGKMDNNEKNQILDNFRNGVVPILVSTTVIELGIDIPSAQGMIIFSANSFGLASLHQLRGRVGRNGQRAYCLLVDSIDDNEDGDRLKFLETCSDGFKVSEKDMELRGPGDFTSIRQSGFPSFSCLNIVSDFKMFMYARDDSTYIVNHLDNLECKRYYEYVLDRMNRNETEMTLFD